MINLNKMLVTTNVQLVNEQKLIKCKKSSRYNWQGVSKVSSVCIKH